VRKRKKLSGIRTRAFGCHGGYRRSQRQDADNWTDHRTGRGIAAASDSMAPTRDSSGFWLAVLTIYQVVSALRRLVIRLVSGVGDRGAFGEIADH